jgi:hypothetical protein
VSHNATLVRSGFKFRNGCGTNRARIADSAGRPASFTQHIGRMAFPGTRSSLPRVGKRRFDDEILKTRDGLESNQNWGRVNRDLVLFVIAGSLRHARHDECHHQVATPSILLRYTRCSRSTPPCGVGGERSSLSRSGVGVHTSSADTATPFPNPPRKGGGRRENQFVLATRGGVGVVMNWVASSMATPSGVGITMRNGTRMRVPSTGANAISMLRAAVRYLITGRSGM